MSASHDKKVAGMAAKLEANTGRSLQAWVALLRADGPSEPSRWQAWLQEEHGLGRFRARLVVSEARRATAG